MKKNIIYFLISGLLSLGKIFTVEAQISDPLENYLKTAAENNPEIQSLFIQYRASLERIPQVGALPDPQLMFNVFISPVETRVGAQRAGISLSQAFPWFGQLGAQQQAVAFQAKSNYEMFLAAKNKLFMNVKSTFYDLYVLESAISITDRNIKLLHSFRELANIKLESGKGSAVDLLRVDMEVAELENQLKRLNDSRAPLYARFDELLNIDSTMTIELPDTLSTITLNEGKNVLLDSLLVHNPDLKKYDYQVSSFEQNMDVARKMGLPSFNLGLSYTFISPRTDMDLPDNGKDVLIFPQVGVRIPLYRNKYKAMVQEQELLRTAKINEKEAHTDRLNTSLEKSWRDYQDAARRVDLYEHLMNLADQALDLIVTQYTTAGKDFEEILRMDRQLLRYELELEKARTDQNTSVAFINYLTGK